MNQAREDAAIVWCEGAFGTSYGKTAHGLVRRSRRYRLVAVIDTQCAGADAGALLDGHALGTPVVADLAAALARGHEIGVPPTHFVIGVAPDSGRLPASGRQAVREAIRAGLHVDSGLHDFLSDEAELAALAARHGVQLRDVRKPPPRELLHGFSGEIATVQALRVAVLGTDSAVGKRTTAWKIVEGLEAAGRSAQLIGTGQTAWLQGAEYSIVLDSLINDFVAGELEHAVVRAWRECRPEVLVIEGQGSLMNPAYPGGLEILAATRPDVVVLQHAPARREYDGFPGYRVQPITTQIEALELVGGRPVVAITVNHDGLAPAHAPEACARLCAETGLPAVDVLQEGPGVIVELLLERLGLGADPGGP